MDVRSAAIELTEDALDFVGFESFKYSGRNFRVEEGRYMDMGIVHSKKIELVSKDMRVAVYFDVAGDAWKITGMYKPGMNQPWEATPEILA